MSWKAQINGQQVGLYWNGVLANTVFALSLDAAAALAASVNREADSFGDDDAHGAARCAAVGLLEEAVGRPVPLFNDDFDTRHADVLAAFDRAILEAGRQDNG